MQTAFIGALTPDSEPALPLHEVVHPPASLPSTSPSLPQMRNNSTKAAHARPQASCQLSSWLRCVPSLAKADGTASIGLGQRRGRETHGTKTQVLPGAVAAAPRSSDASLSEAVVRPQSALAAD